MMKWFQQTAISCFLASTLIAQGTPDPLTWTLGGSQLELRLYDRQGILATTLPNPAFFPFLMEGVKLRDGSVWFNDSFFGQLHHVGPSGLIATQNAFGVERFVAHPSGGFLVLRNPSIAPLSNSVFELRDSSGSVLAAANLQISSLIDLLCDSSGAAWIIQSLGATRFSASGVVDLQLSFPEAVQRSALDGQGRLWVGSLNTGRIYHYSSSGALIGSATHSDLLDLVPDANGRIRAFRTPLGGMPRLETLDPLTLGSRGALALPLPTSAPISRIDFDSTGRAWAIDGSGGLWLFDPTSPNAHFVDTLSTQPQDGVINGLPLVRLEPDADFDGDGFMNRDEVGAGSDPMIGIDTPLLITPATPPVAGQPLALNFDAPFRPGDLFFTGASLTSLATGAPLSHVHAQEIPIAFDSLFWFWVSPGNPLLPGGSSGVLDAAGHATLPLVLPPGSTGLSFFVTAISFDPTNGQPGRASLAVPITIL